jgi:hypothetical protein
MTPAFEIEKNRKAFVYTVLIVVGLLILFFIIRWKIIPPSQPVVQDLIEINLGNNEDGFGEEQPLIKGERSPNPEATVIPRTSAPQQSAQDEVAPDENAEATAAPVVKPIKKAEKPVKNDAPPSPTPKPAPKPQKPKITYNGPGKGGGNNADQDNGYQYQGNKPGGKGDNGDPTGNKDSYGNTPGGKIGGPKIIQGNRSFRGGPYNFQSELQPATIKAVIKVDPSGNGTFIRIEKGSTSHNPAYSQQISQWLAKMKFTTGKDDDLITVLFNFHY